MVVERLAPIGVTDAKRAEADGTTILCTISSSLIQSRVTVKDLPYDPEKDFIYLTMVSGAGGPVVAAKKTGAKNLREFIDYAKKVGSLNWGSYGVGSTSHVLIETIAKQYGIKFQVIQYRGEAPMWNDIAGQTLDGAAGSFAAFAIVGAFAWGMWQSWFLCAVALLPIYLTMAAASAPRPKKEAQQASKQLSPSISA